ncbi:endonuclease/exonuclease/phosphatase family protein [Nocardia brasiliensis]
MTVLPIPGTAAVSSTMRLDRVDYQAGATVSVSYTTNEARERNWIGIYGDPGNGPANDQNIGGSTKWVYAPGGSGQVQLSTSGLAAGQYVAYFLFDDGYRRLTHPAKFRIAGADRAGTATMMLDQLDYPAGAPITAAYTTSEPRERNWIGVYSDPGNGPANDQNVGASTKWAYAPGNSGQVSIPTAGLPIGQYVAYLLFDDGYRRLTNALKFRIVPGGAATALTVAAFNTWHAGTQVNNGFDKALDFIISSAADVVLIQESEGRFGADAAARLGWYAQQSTGSLAILSRYRIKEQFSANAGLGVRLDLGSGKEAVVWSVHLDYLNYGPYAACYEGKSAAEIENIERNTSGRVRQITDVLSKAKPQLDAARSGGAPVFIGGDFNAPSHLDWTPATANSHCGYNSVNWPASRAVADAGLKDSYRVVNPDPATSPGNTWSPVYPKHNGSTGAAEPQDRIDLVTYLGAATPRTSRTEVRGTAQPVPDHANNQWPTDHRAVITEFTLG